MGFCMPSRKTTTVVLTQAAREIKNRYAVPMGLKGVLSVGLELFAKLPDSEKIARVRAALEADKLVSGAESDAAKQRGKTRRRRTEA